MFSDKIEPYTTDTSSKIARMFSLLLLNILLWGSK